VLTGARAELAIINVQLAAANAALRRTQEPVTRLRRCIADADLAQRDLEAAQSTERGIVAAWLSGGMQGPRPEPSEPLLQCERRVAETARDAAAARQALPDHEAVVAEAAKLVSQLSTDRTKACVSSAIEAAKQFCADHLVPAIAAFRRAEHELRNLEDALTVAVHYGAAEQLREIINAAKSAAPPKPDVAVGTRFLAELLRDPMAELGA